MEELLKQILKNQLVMNEEIIKIQCAQVEIMEKIKEIDNVKNDMNSFNKEAMEHLKKLDNELHANLDDIAFIFKQHDSRFSRAN